ncbi:unnamed protein product [Cuscuta campestris]|uniref:Retrotransposon gag domain-containing protein n=1 Tax=Cuscuta campestris TaxID=132261 RepID=A0A484L0U4_9ASTE|nr:unnamed protein product [Cuscuta campestris]
MHFLLTTLKVVHVLGTLMPEIMEKETLKQTRKRCKWESDDFICRGHILNGDITLPEYRQKFIHLAKFAPTFVGTMADCIKEFRSKLRLDLRAQVSIIHTIDFTATYNLIAKADKDWSAYKEYLKKEEVGSNVRRPVSTAPSGKILFQGPSNSQHSKKGKSVQTQPVASVDRPRKWKHPICELYGRNHPGEC